MKIADIYEEAGVCSLPVDPIETAKRLGVKVISYEAAAEFFNREKPALYGEDPLGFCFERGGEVGFAINENACGVNRRRFTAAHELGHIVMGHAGRVTTSADERAADRFAAELLAPLAVLSECGVRTAEEISRLCGISEQAAEIRLAQLAEYERCRGADADGARIGEQFGGFIKRYRESRGGIMPPLARLAGSCCGRGVTRRIKVFSPPPTAGVNRRTKSNFRRLVVARLALPAASGGKTLAPPTVGG